MARKQNRYRRNIGKRRIKRLFLVATEGKVTEPQYLDMLNKLSQTATVKCVGRSTGKDPKNTLRKLEESIKENELRKGDEAWIVIDRDKWEEDILESLSKWAEEKQWHGFALSNPKFEYWLLLHFEDSKSITSSKNCTGRLKRYLPDYDKSIDARKLKDKISIAVDRAKKRDNPPCADWPRNTGTTVYRLVERILEP